MTLHDAGGCAGWRDADSVSRSECDTMEGGPPSVASLSILGARGLGHTVGAQRRAWTASSGRTLSGGLVGGTAD